MGPENVETMVINQQPYCMEHSGMKANYQNIEKGIEEQKNRIDNVCSKIDNLKFWIIGLLGAAVVNLALQIIKINGM